VRPTRTHAFLIESNRLALRVELVVLALLVLALVPAALFPKYDIGFVYPVMIVLVPLAALGALVTGIAAAGFHLVGRLERFWDTAASLNLAFLCLFLAFTAIPPPPAAGAVGGAALGLACAAVLLRRDAPPRKMGLLPALALPFAGVLPPLSFWAPLAAALLFIGVWTAVRLGWGGFRFPE